MATGISPSVTKRQFRMSCLTTALFLSAQAMPLCNALANPVANGALKPGAKPAAQAPSATAAKSGHLPAVLEFGASWCAPCKIFEPTFEKVKAQYVGKCDFKSYDADKPDAKPLMQKYSVGALPTVVILDRNGKQVSIRAGALDEATFLSEVRKVAR